MGLVILTTGMSVIPRHDANIIKVFHEIFFQENKELVINDVYLKKAMSELVVDTLADLQQSITFEFNQHALNDIVSKEDFNDCSCDCSRNEQIVLNHFRNILIKYLFQAQFSIEDDKLFTEQAKKLQLKVTVEKENEDHVFFQHICYSILVGVAATTIYLLVSKKNHN